MADTASSFSFSCFFHAHATQPPSGATRCRFFLFLIFNISLVYTRITLYSRRGGHSQSLLIFRYIYIYIYISYTWRRRERILGRDPGGVVWVLASVYVCTYEHDSIYVYTYVQIIMYYIYIIHNDNNNLVIICLGPYLWYCVLDASQQTLYNIIIL